ncbi:MAG: GIY-YIG nuclease family protein [Lentisphaerae bacterium]|nr:GIY-YIG nuclease family protein [Lentisphaerota bacterium]
MYWTYILFSPSLNRHYVGQTQDICQRLHYHVEVSTPATARSKDWLLVFLEGFSTRQLTPTRQ